MCNEELIAPLDTGSGGNNCGLSLVSQAFRNMWKKPFGKKLRPVYQSAATVGGEKLDILDAVTVNLEINGCSLQQDVLVVRNMQQPVILGWDFLLQTSATTNCNSGIVKLENYGIELNLLKKSETLPKPCLTRCKKNYCGAPKI